MSENMSSRLEKKIDGLVEDMATVKTTLFEREKAEILRNEVISQAMKTQDTTMCNLDKRIIKLEETQNKVAWLIISTVMLAIIGTVIITNTIVK
jgi:hypothetical protein